MRFCKTHPVVTKAFKNLKDDTFQTWSDPLPFSKNNHNEWRFAGMLWRLTDFEWLTQVNQYVLSPPDLIDLLPSRCPFIRRYSDIIMQLLHSSIFIPSWTHWSRNDIWDTFIQLEIYFRSDWNFSSAFIDRRPRIKILFQIIFSQTLKYFSGRTCNGIKSKGLSKKTNSDLKTRESENVILDLSIWLELKTAFIFFFQPCIFTFNNQTTMTQRRGSFEFSFYLKSYTAGYKNTLCAR